MLESLENVRTFQKLIDSVDVNPEAEKIVRDVLVGVSQDAPIPIIREMAQCTLDIRKRELATESSSN